MSLSALKSFVAAAPVADVCGLCSSAIGETHPHLFDRTREALECACPGCAMLFSGNVSGRWVPVPHRSEKSSVITVDDASWNALALPIGLVFFVRSSAAKRLVAWYPGPAGATRCQLSFDLPQLQLAEDVEALVVNRLYGAHAEYVLSLDQCFALVGEIRRVWRGFTGGAAVRETVTRFFARVDAGGSARA